MSPPEAENTDTAPQPGRRFGPQALIAALLVAAVLAAVTLAQVAAPVLLGALLAGFSAPLHRLVLGWIGRRSLAAALVTVFLFLVVLAPLAAVMTMVVLQLQDFLTGDQVRAFFSPEGGLQKLLARYPNLKGVVPKDAGAQLSSAVEWVVNGLPALFTGLTNLVIALFLTALTTYFVLRDGGWIYRRIENALPLEPRHTLAIASEFQRVGRAFFMGTLGVAAIQGSVGGLGYLALGVPRPLLLGALTAVVSVVPAVGSALVWVPMAIYLMATGHLTQGFVLVGFGMLIVGTVDNILRPILQRGGLAVHPLLMFLAIFGGLAAFGASGLYLGPLFVALFMAVAHIYERELAPGAAQEAEPAEERPGLWRSVAMGLRRRR